MTETGKSGVRIAASMSPCSREQLRAPPCGLVIFGASGDLTFRKLLPAVYQLYRQGFLNERFFVLGVARSDFDDRVFRERVRQILSIDGQSADGFLKLLYYHRLEYSRPGDYHNLATRLQQLASETGMQVLFHLALPPDLHGQVAAGLASAGLAGRSRQGTRLVVEKPFGRDLVSAQRLSEELLRHFDERQIYRIDHYLAKETVQNLLVFRFANGMFEPLWNRQHVQRVEIHAGEKVGVGRRAGYYDRVGVLRDMMQNHMMQLLALAAMEPPAGLSSEQVRDEKVKVYRQLRPLNGNTDANVVLGQYGQGNIDGRQVVGYRQEPQVASDSMTPTFAAIRVYIDSWRWQGVPFLLVSGKRLAEKRTEIRIVFRRAPKEMFRGQPSANQLVFNINPHKLMELHFQAKQTGPRLDTRQVVMSFDYDKDHPCTELDDYARVLLDALHGEQMLFWRQDGVELCWEYLEPLLAECEDGSDRQQRIQVYTAGSGGPDLSALRS